MWFQLVETTEVDIVDRSLVWFQLTENLSCHCVDLGCDFNKQLPLWIDHCCSFSKNRTEVATMD